MKKSTSVSIGIPAYNEEANIGFLIQDILHQNTKSFTLVKIIVFSDGSTDNTVAISNSLKNKNIKVIENKTRAGVANAQNQIIKKINSDVLVLLNADIMINDNQFIEKLIKPIVGGKGDLTSPVVKELKAKNFFEKTINEGSKMKRHIFEKVHQGNNIYDCHGNARAFSKRLYKKINFRYSLAEDAFSYLYCVSNKYKFIYVKNTAIHYRNPNNLGDHLKRSTRFFHSKKQLSYDFAKEFINDNYQLPNKIILKTLFRFFIKKPVYIFFYLTILLVIKIKASFSTPQINQWDISPSTKLLRSVK